VERPPSRNSAQNPKRAADPAIYAAVDRELGITSPAEVLYIDDNAANIASAAAYGWRTLHFI